MKQTIALFLLIASVACAQRTTIVPPVRGTREMVVAANNQEVAAGLRILNQGGNAIDAGVATVLAAAVTEQSRFGLGGEMPLIVKRADRAPEVISGVGQAPKLATVDFYRNRQPDPWETSRNYSPIPANGILAATVPGAFDGLILALQRHGTMPFAKVAEPAIDYAENGFPIAEEYAAFLANYEVILNVWPTARKFHFADGRVPKRGEIVRYPDLARTLKELAQVERKARGKREAKLEAVRNHFYKGPLAKRIAASSEEYQGLIRYEDLAAYRATYEEPLCGEFRGYQICKPGFWTQGPVMIQALNILEGIDLASLGHNSPEYLHTVVEAVKLAFADRDAHYGDPKFSTIPSEILLSKDYGRQRSLLINSQGADLSHRPGQIGNAKPTLVKESGQTTDQDTTCVNVVDRHGNVFNATPSGAWLPAVIAGDTGIPFGTRLQSFVLDDGHANQLMPGKRPRVTLSPTLVLKDGKAVIAMSTPGGDNQDQSQLQVLLNMLVFGMTAQEAVEAPRFQTDHYQASFGNHDFSPGNLMLEARIPEEVRTKLAEKGHKVRVQPDWGNSSAPGLIHIRDGVLDAGADPRRARIAFGR